MRYEEGKVNLYINFDTISPIPHLAVYLFSISHLKP